MLALEHAKHENELRTLQDVSEERVSLANGDLLDVAEQSASLAASFAELCKAHDEDLTAEARELECKFGPGVEALQHELDDHEADIAASVDAVRQMKDRLFDLKDRLKDIVVEHATKVAKQETQAYDVEEKRLAALVEQELALAEELKKKEESVAKVIETVHSKFSEQMAKAEKVMVVLKKSKEKITAELEMALSEKNQLTVLFNHREETYYQLVEETKMMKASFDETVECMQMYQQYMDLRGQNPAASVPFTHNKLLNQIIGVDNILEQEIDDNRRLVDKLRQQEEFLIQRHADSAQALGEIRIQFNKALDSAKKLSYEMNKVFAYVSASSS